MELLKMIKQASDDLGPNANAVGKNRGDWVTFSRALQSGGWCVATWR